MSSHSRMNAFVIQTKLNKGFTPNSAGLLRHSKSWTSRASHQTQQAYRPGYTYCVDIIHSVCFFVSTPVLTCRDHTTVPPGTSVTCTASPLITRCCRATKPAHRHRHRSTVLHKCENIQIASPLSYNDEGSSSPHCIADLNQKHT